MLGDRFVTITCLSVAVMCLSITTMLNNIPNVPGDLFSGVVLVVIVGVLTVVLTIVLYERYYMKRDPTGQKASVEENFLSELSVIFSSEEKLIVVGVKLGIPYHRIEAVYEDKGTSITNTARVMLLRWYTDQGELNLDQLQTALNEAGLANLSQEFIGRYLENRRRQMFENT